MIVEVFFMFYETYIVEEYSFLFIQIDLARIDYLVNLFLIVFIT